ncbi:hypothetical protein ACFLTP_05935 [Chloroflexota bacterium]
MAEKPVALPLNDDELIAIGKIAAYFAYLDILLTMSIWSLISPTIALDSPRGIAITGKMSYVES